MPVRSEARIREALPSDAAAIAELLAAPAAAGLILPRSEEDIRSLIGNFQVAATDDGGLAGCVALRDFGNGLLEVRSLAVHPESRGAGLGTRLVEAAVRRARQVGGRLVFALTYRPSLFERLSFTRVDKEMFPDKVWHDCSKCPKRDFCDETALLLHL